MVLNIRKITNPLNLLSGGFPIIFIFLIFSCLPFERVTKVHTGLVSEITSNSCAVQGTIVDIGEEGIIQHGHCVSVTPGPTINNDKTELGAWVAPASFASNLINLAPDQKYYVKAYAIDSKGKQYYGNEINFTTLNTPVPAAPSNLLAEPVSKSQINLGWSDNSDNEDGFRIERSPDGSTNWAEIVTVGTGITIFQNISLSPNTAYFYRVRAYNTGGNSGYSNTANATTKSDIPVPAAPTNLAADAESSSQITINWTDNANNEEGFKIERSTNDLENWSEIKVVGPDTTNFLNVNLSSSTTYFYRVRAFNTGGNSDYSNTANATTCKAPIAITTDQTNIGATIVTLKGIVNPNNYLTDVIFEYGPTPDFGFIIPAIQSPITGINEIEVSAEVTDLFPNSRYYYRVKAVSCGGTTYGDNLTFVTDPLEVYDANDNVYHVVHIGTQLWTKENLIATIPWDASGDVPLIADEIEWSNLTSPGYCWYNNDARYKDIYGALYNWWAVSWRRLCPVDWHVPTEADWRILTNYLGGESVAGGKMKEVGFDHWESPNTDATNESGFTALPGGYRADNGTFYLIKSVGQWWTSSEYSTDDAWSRSMGYGLGSVGRGTESKKRGISVRCIRDY